MRVLVIEDEAQVVHARGLELRDAAQTVVRRTDNLALDEGVQGRRPAAFANRLNQLVLRGVAKG